VSYTSNSEFDANTRVQITNEIPPYDFYEGVNSALTDGIWKWLLGYTSVTFDVDTKTKLLEGHTFDSTSAKESYLANHKDYYAHKTVNGVDSETYGPTTSTTYHSMELNGVLVPEEDLFLHEIYRYLYCLYPDHPDWTQLLTNAEINDAISSAAAMVNYTPDNNFFELVAESLDSSQSTDDKNIESFKIKFRNLTDNAFRRKLYGSRFGYRMFTNDIFQTCSIFPLGTYLPILPVDKSLYTTSDSGTTKNDLVKGDDGTYNIDSQSSLQSDGSTFCSEVPTRSLTNRFIDTYDSHYQNKFRLIDWDGSSQDYTKSEEAVSTISGFVTPCHESTFIEFPLASSETSSISSYLSTSDHLYGDSETSYTNIDSVTTVAIPAYTGYIKDNSDGSKSQAFTLGTDSSSYAGKITESQQETVKLHEMYYTRPIDTSTSGEKITGASINTSRLIDLFGQYSSLNSSQSDRKVSITPDFSVAGRFYLSLGETLKYYRSFIDFDKSTGYPISDTGLVISIDDNSGTMTDRNNWPPLNSDLNSINTNNIDLLCTDDTTKLSEDIDDNNNRLASTISSFKSNCKLLADDVISNTNSYITTTEAGEKTLSTNIYMNIVSGFVGGYVKVVNTVSAAYDYVQTSPHNWAMYGFIVTNCNNEKIVLLGNLDVTFGTSNPNDSTDTLEYNIQPVGEKLTIKAIPEKKTANMMRLCYGLSETQVEALSADDERWNNRSLIYNDNNSTFYSSYTSGVKVGMTLENVIGISTNSGKKISYEILDIYGKGTISYIDFGSIATVPIYNSSLYTLNTTQYTFSSPFYFYSSESSAVAHMRLFDEYIENKISLPMTSSALSVFASGILTTYNISKESYTSITISSVIDISSDSTADLITFTDDTSKARFASLSVGDKVYGPSLPIVDEDSDGVDDEIYITEILTNQVRVNKALTQSGTFDLIFKCKASAVKIDTSDDIENYRKKLFNSNSLILSDPFAHGLWPSAKWPSASASFVDGLIDSSKFVPFEGYNSKQIKCLNNIVIPAIYGDKLDILGKDKNGSVIYSNKLIPCSIKFKGDLFIDIDINRLFYIENRQGTTPTLMNVEWLDYLTNNGNELSRASDNVSFGANLMLETDTSGFYTMISDMSYTDPTTRVKFQTLNWTDNTVPVYAQIGTAGSGYSSIFKSIDSVTYPTVYDVAVYDKTIKNISEIQSQIETDREPSDDDNSYVNEATAGNLKTRHVYTDTSSLVDTGSASTTNRTQVENPIAEIPLGEYDIQMHYRPTYTDQTNFVQDEGDVMTVQLNFYKQTFKNISKHISGIKINPESLEASDCLNDINSSTLDNINWKDNTDTAATEFTDETTSVDTIQGYTFNYLGDWVPKVTIASSGNTLNFPTMSTLIADYRNGKIDYYIVKTGQTFHNILLSSSNDIDSRYIEGNISNSNTYEEVDSSEKYSVVIESQSILTITPDLGNANGFRWSNKKLTLIGGLGDLSSRNLIAPYNMAPDFYNYDTGNSTFDPATSSTVIERKVIKAGLLNELLNKTIGSYSAYSRTSLSAVTTNGTTTYSGTAYYAPNYHGGIGSWSLTGYDSLYPKEYYLHAIDRYFNKDETIDSTPYFILDDDKLQSRYSQFAQKIYFGTVIPYGSNTKDMSEDSKKRFDHFYEYAPGGTSFILFPEFTYNKAGSTKKGTLQFKIGYLNASSHFGSTLSLGHLNILTEEFEYLVSEDIAWRKRCDEYTNEIALPRSFIADGSYDIKLILDPSFTSTVYYYDSYVLYKSGTITKSQLDNDKDSSGKYKYHEDRVISDSAIYYDSTYDCFYIKDQVLNSDYVTSHTITDDSNTVSVNKYVIKFNENKFYKNTEYITGEYQLSTSQNNNSTDIIETPTITPVSGIDFNADTLSTNDRLLKANLIQLRSVYSNALDHIVFSAYQTLDGQFDSVDADNNTLKISYDYGSIATSTSDSSGTTGEVDPYKTIANRQDFSSQLTNLLPAVTSSSTTTVYSDTSYVDFGDNAKFTWSDQNATFDSPKVVTATATNLFTTGSVASSDTSGTDDLDFKYYKNLLILEGKIDTSNPKVILSDGSNQFSQGLNMINSGDTVIDCVILSGGTKVTKTLSIKCKNSSGSYDDLKINFITYVNGYFIASNGGQVYYYSAPNIASVSTIYLTKINNVITSDSGDITSVSYSDNYFYLTFKDSIASSTEIYSLYADINVNSQFTKAFSASEAYSTDDSGNIEYETDSNGNQLLDGYGNPIPKLLDTSGTLTSDQLSHLTPSVADDTSTNVITILDYKSDQIYTSSIEASVFGRDVIHAKVQSSWTDFPYTIGATSVTSNSGTIINPTHKYYAEAKYFSVEDSVSPLYASSDTGYEAMIKGSTLFVKSPTETVSNGAYSGTNTTFFHWKAASLPTVSDNFRSLFDSLPDDEFYDQANEIIQNYVSYTIEEPTSTSTVIINQYRAEKALQNYLIALLKYGVLGTYKVTGSANTSLTLITESQFKSIWQSRVNTPSSDTWTDPSYTFYIPGIKYVYNSDTKAYEPHVNANYDSDDSYYQAMFNSVNAKRFSSDAERTAYTDYFITGYAISTHPNIAVNNEENVATYATAYRKMLLDVIQYGLGYNNKTMMFGTDPQSIFFDDKYLYIQTGNSDMLYIKLENLTRRDYIEDDSNWNSVTYPKDTTYAVDAELNAHYYAYVNSDDSQSYNIVCPSPRILKKTFVITSTYQDSGVVVYAGYKVSGATVKTSYIEDSSSETADSFISDAKLASSYTVPFIMYSYDKGSFGIPTMPDEIAFDSSNPDNGIGTSVNGKIVSVITVKDNLYALVAYTPKGKSYSVLCSKALKISKSSTGVWDFTYGTADTSMVWTDRPDDTLCKAVSGAYVSEEDATSSGEEAVTIYSTPISTDGTLVYKSGGTAEVVLTCNNAISSTNAESLTVSEKSGGSITVSSDIMEQTTDSSTARVLVSIYTSNDIIDPSIYIHKENLSDYTLTDGKLKVSDSKEVDSYTIADRMYNRREVMAPEYKVVTDSSGNTVYETDSSGNNVLDSSGNPIPKREQITDSTGYPSVDEDTDQKFYQYSSGAVDTLTNSLGNTVYLCNKDGSYFVQNNSDTPVVVRFASLYKIVKNGMAISSSIEAPKPVYFTVTDADKDTDLRSINSDLTAIMKEALNSNPTIKYFSVANSNPYIIIKFDSTFNVKEKLGSYFYHASTATVVDSTKTYYTYDSSTEKYTKVDSPSGSPAENGYYIFDTSQFNSTLYLKFMLHVPYISYAGISSFTNQQFVTSVSGTKAILSDAGSNPISSIYIPIGGYGGFREQTENWNSTTEDSLPWVLDEDAFSDLLLYNTLGEPVYLSDSSGTLLTLNGSYIQMHRPLYSGLSNLISNLGFSIKNTRSDMKWEYFTAKDCTSSVADILSIADDYTSITLKKKLDPTSGNICTTNGSTIQDINDGEKHIITLKVLTKTPITLDISNMNNPDYFIEIPISDAENYGFDRVYMPDDGYPKSPIKINNSIFRSENNDKYIMTEYTTDQGDEVYECNSDGYYIGYSRKKNTSGDYELVGPTVLGATYDSTGAIVSINSNLSSDIYYGVDHRFRPYTPRYSSCQNWYKGEYYKSGDEKNPYWQVIDFTSEFNKRSMAFNQKATLCTYRKNSSEMELQELTDTSERYVKIYKAPTITQNSDAVIIYPYGEYINLQTGNIRFVLTQNEESSYYSSSIESFVKYGITVNNPKNPTTDSDYSKAAFTDSVNGTEHISTLNSFLMADYSINTSESFVDKFDKDKAITQISEVGLFDKNHKLVAYATFPPIEYRTDTQHVDFTMVISYDSLTKKIT
jgi:hypothetical protein